MYRQTTDHANCLVCVIDLETRKISKFIFLIDGCLAEIS